MVEYSNSNNVPIETIEIKNIKDDSKFNKVLLKQIYNHSSGEIFTITDYPIAKKNFLVIIMLTQEHIRKYTETVSSYKGNKELTISEDEFVDDSGYTIPSQKNSDRSISTQDIELANKINILKESGLI